MKTTNLFKAFSAKWLLWAATIMFFGTASVQEAHAQATVLNSSTNSTYYGGAPATIVDPNLTLVGSSNHTGAKVAIGSGFATTDRLSFTPMHGITGSYNTTTGILTLNGTATSAQYQDVLRSVTYSNTVTNITSGSSRTITFTIGNALYNENNGHFYELINNGSNIHWTTAKNNAAARTFYGLQGYLVTVTSSQENTFLSQKISSNTWMGASDAASEGTWRWVTGPEGLENSGQGRHFSNQFKTGACSANTAPGINGYFAAWGNAEPNDCSNNEDVAHFIGSTGTWNDFPHTGGVTYYLVEYGGMPGDPSIQVTDNIALSVQPTPNYAPVLTNTTFNLTAINEDATGSSPVRVSTLLSGAYTDINGDASGMAVIGTTGNGTWQQSTDGNTWYGVDYNSPGGAPVSATNAKLLSPNMYIRFVPAANWYGTATMSFRAWDQSSGSNLAFVNASTNGGNTAFSSQVGTTSIVVNAVNDAPEVVLPNSAYVLNFGGGNEYVDLPDLNITGPNMTVEAWVYVDNANKNWSRIIDFGNGPGTDNIIFGFEGTTGHLFAEIYNGTSIKLSAPSAFPENQWVHVACVWNGTTATIYQNGVSVASGAQRPIGNLTRTNNYIGKSNWADEYYDGKMMDIRIWNTARSQSDIQNNMSSLLAGNEAGLMLYYKSSEGGTTYLPEYTAENDYGAFHGVNWVTQTVPVISVSTPFETPLTINGVSVTDIDALGNVEASFSVTNGKIRLSPSVSGGITAGNISYLNDSAEAIITGATVTSINATLADADGLVYTPENGFSGSDELDVEINDLGSYGSGGAQTDLKTLAINVFPSDNRAPVFTNQAWNVNENTPNSSVVGTFGATDADAGDVLTYTILSGNANGAFAVSGGTLIVSNSSALDFELGNNTYTLVVEVSDADEADTATITVNVLDVNEAPTITDATLTIDEDEATRLAGKIGYDMYADVDGDTIREFRVVTVPANGQLLINGSVNVVPNTPYNLNQMIGLEYIPAANFFGADSIVFEVSDGQLYAQGTGTLSITVNSVNDIPVIQDVIGSVYEDVSTQVLSLFDSTTYTDVENSPAAWFQITTVPANGTISFNGNPVNAGDVFNLNDALSLMYLSDLNYHGPDSFAFNISDGTDYAASPATVYMNVLQVADAPTDITLSPASVDENLPAGTLVGTLTATDVEIGDSHTFQIVNNAGYFVINGDQLYTNAMFNYEMVNSYDIEVIASDIQGATYTKTLTISINDANDAPTAIVLSNNQVAETMTINSLVGILTASDEDALYTHTYSLVSGAGDFDNNSFVINNNLLQSNTTFDYSVQQQYSVRVRVTDDHNASYETIFTIYVNDIGMTPTDISLVSNVVRENEPVGTVVGMLSSVDADLGDTHTYILVNGAGGNGNSMFTINGNLLQTATGFNYEVLTSTTIRVRTTDSYSLTFDKVLTVTVQDVNEPIVSMSLSNTLVAENMPAGTTVGLLSSVDTDLNDTHTYALVTGTGDSGNSFFRITGNTLYTHAMFDYETQDTYSIRVRSTDSEGHVLETVYTINIADGNDAPTDVAVDVLSIDENSPLAATIGFISTTDIDANNTHTYTLVNGIGDADNASFSVLANKLLVNDNFNFEAKNSYQIRLRSTDQNGLWIEKAFVVSINDVNETPTGIIAQTYTITENEPAGTLVATLSATDVDAGDSHTFSLVSGAGDADNALFTINGNHVETSAPLNFEAQSVYSFRVQATDLGGLKYELAVQISITDANDAPAITSITKVVNTESRIAQFTIREFRHLFFDEDNDALVSISINSLPSNGILYLKNIPVSVGTVVDVLDLAKLKYIPNSGFVGTDSFMWTAFDGSDNSAPAQAIIHVNPMRGSGPIAQVNWNNLFSASGNGTQRLDGTTGVDEIQIEDAELSAYPNPFSGQLSIGFQLPVDGEVSLKVYDMSGKLIQVLINENLNAGKHSTTWNSDKLDGSQISAGQYILQMMVTDINGEVVAKTQKLSRF